MATPVTDPQLLALLNGQQQTGGRVYSNDGPSPLDPPSGRDRDLAIRTMLSEAGNQGPDGLQAVASVIRNRAVAGSYGGDTPTGVVTARNQFEPWNTPQGRQRMASYDPSGAAYTQASQALERAYEGEDPTRGATHFYAPKAQAALGRRPPSWDNGRGQDIGDHRFFGGAPAQEVSAQSRQPRPVTDPALLAALEGGQPSPNRVVTERVGEFQPPQNAPALQSGLSQQAAQMQNATRGPAVDPLVRQSVEMQNQQIAGGQGTTPIMDLQMQNLITDQVFENDAGLAVFRDPATGQLVEADQNRHVILRDPQDNRLKVFARSQETAENPAVSGARVLAQGLAAGAPTARASVAAAPALKPSQEVAAAADRIGVGVPRAVATDSMAAQRVAGAVRNIPIAGDPLIAASGRTVQQLGDKAGEVAGGFGGGTVAGSGDAAKSAINRYVTGTTKERASKLYDAVDELVDNNVLAPLPKTQETVARLLARRGDAALPPGGAIDQLKEALSRPGLTYQGLKTLRTNVGEDVSRSILPQGMSQGDLKQIYSALSDDLKGAVEIAGGAKASAAFARANKYYDLVSSRREALAKIVGTAGDAPAERVFDRLVAMASGSSRADIAGLMQARKAIGAEDWNEFVSGVVAQMGRSPALKGAPESLQGADFSPERFLTAYNKLSDAGRAALFRSGGKGDLDQALKDIATVSSRFRELQKFSNPSGTAQNTIGAATGASVVLPLLAGDIVTPLKIVGGVVGGRVLAGILASPAKAASLADWSKKYEAAVRVPNAPRVALLTVASRNLANNLKDSGVTVTAQDFLRAIQGPMRGAAEDEKQ